MANIRPLLKVETGRPDYLGRIDKRAYWLDLPFQPSGDNPAKSMRGIAGGPRSQFLTPWTYMGCLRIPEVGVIIRPTPLVTAEALSRWTGSGSYLRADRPNGSATAFMHWYDAAASCPAQTSTFSLAENEPFRLTVIYAASQTSANLRVGWDSGGGYRFEFDAANDRVQLYDVDAGAVLEEFQSGAWRSAMQRSTTQVVRLQLTFLPLEDYLVIYLDGVDTPIVYREESLTLPAAPVTLSFGGGVVWWQLAPLEYTTHSGATVELAQTVTVPSVFAVPENYVFFRDQQNGTDADMDLQVAGATMRPTITLTTTVASRTPIVYLAQAGANATFTTPALSLATIPNAQIVACEVTLSERSAGGNQARLTIRDFPVAQTIWRNGFLRIYLGWDTGVGGTADTLVFEGRLKSPQPQLDGEESLGQRVWHLEAESWGACLTDGRKKMIRMPSFGHWAVGDMLTTVLTGAGLPEAYLSVDPGLGSVVLPGWADEQRFAYHGEENVGRALDEMLAEVLMEWGEVLSPSYAVRVRHPVHYTGIPDATLAASSTLADLVRSFHYEEDDEAIRNFVWAEAAGKDGGGWPAVVADTDSLSDETSPYFVGEWWDLVERLPDGYAPDVAARRLWRERLQNARTAEWEWEQAHLGVFPGAFVAVNVNALEPRVATGAVFRVTQKRISWGPNTNRLSETYLGVRVT